MGFFALSQSTLCNGLLSYCHSEKEATRALIFQCDGEGFGGGCLQRSIPASFCHPSRFGNDCRQFCHRFMRKCSGRLEIIGKACFLYGPVFGCRIGSGAEASPHTVTSICSTPPVSMGYSTGA